MSAPAPSPIRKDPDELRAEYVAALRREARHQSQQDERRAAITRREFLRLDWHPTNEQERSK